MTMTNDSITYIDPDTLKNITDTIDDTVAYLAQECFENGTPVSGETLYKIINAWSATKEAEFRGEFNV